MKEGQTLTELAEQIRFEQEAKHDYVALTDRLTYRPEIGERGAIEFDAEGKNHVVEPNNHCLRQITDRAHIPSKYVDRMLAGEHQELLAHNINYWWRNTPEPRMLRTLQNGSSIGRAFLSERYRPLDNADLAEIVLPKLAEVGCNVISCQITETRLYIQAATPRMQARIDEIRAKHGWRQGNHRLLELKEPVQMGALIVNSEVGMGSLRIEPMLYWLRCLNGLVTAEAIRKYHVGRHRHNGGDVFAELDSAAECYSDKTREMDDRVFWMKVKDVMDSVFTKERFDKLTYKFAETGTVPLKIGGTEAVEEVTKRFQLTEGEKNGVINHLIEGGDLSLFGLVNAVTRASSDVESYDRAVELQRIGGEIIELPRNLWSNN